MSVHFTRVTTYQLRRSDESVTNSRLQRVRLLCVAIHAVLNGSMPKLPPSFWSRARLTPAPSLSVTLVQSTPSLVHAKNPLRHDT